MSDLVHDTQHEFWRPPATHPAAALADACRRCDTEFMVGAAFCHVCGSNRHRASASPARDWRKYFAARTLDLARVRDAIGLPVPALCAFLTGVGFLVIALSMGLMSARDHSDFEAIQFWRIQWLLAACAAFLAGILLKSRKPEN
jgi:hypothetical protein